MTTGAYYFVSVILNVTPVVALISDTGGLALGLASCVVSSIITQFLDPIKIKNTSQLINDISKFFQKLLKCFNGTENSTSFVFPSLAVFPVILVLYLKDSEFVIGLAEISLV